MGVYRYVRGVNVYVLIAMQDSPLGKVSVCLKRRIQAMGCTKTQLWVWRLAKQSRSVNNK